MTSRVKVAIVIVPVLLIVGAWCIYLRRTAKNPQRKEQSSPPAESPLSTTNIQPKKSRFPTVELLPVIPAPTVEPKFLIKITNKTDVPQVVQGITDDEQGGLRFLPGAVLWEGKECRLPGVFDGTLFYRRAMDNVRWCRHELSAPHRLEPGQQVTAQSELEIEAFGVRFTSMRLHAVIILDDGYIASDWAVVQVPVAWVEWRDKKLWPDAVIAADFTVGRGDEFRKFSSSADVVFFGYVETLAGGWIVHVSDCFDHKPSDVLRKAHLGFWISQPAVSAETARFRMFAIKKRTDVSWEIIAAGLHEPPRSDAPDETGSRTARPGTR